MQGSWFEELFSCFLHYLPFNVLSTLFVGFVPVHKDVILGPRTLRCTKQVRNTLKIFRLGGIVDEVLEALQLQQRVKLGLGLFAPVSKVGGGACSWRSCCHSSSCAAAVRDPVHALPCIRPVKVQLVRGMGTTGGHGMACADRAHHNCPHRAGPCRFLHFCSWAKVAMRTYSWQRRQLRAMQAHSTL